MTQRGRALIIDIWSSGGARTNLADGMGAPTSSLASLEWRGPRRTSVFCSLSAEELTEPRKVLLAGLRWKKTMVSHARKNSVDLDYTRGISWT